LPLNGNYLGPLLIWNQSEFDIIDFFPVSLFTGISMSERNQFNYEIAIRDFKRARKQAAIHHLLAQLRGKSDELLAYDYIRQQLRGSGTIERGVQEIPLDAIVGSVGRYDDFTRDFFPKKDSIQERWAQVKAAIMNMTGMSPISVYKLGDGYFVRDGNHRVSVARTLGTNTISALVTEVKSKVPLSIDDDPDTVMCKARYAEFLEKTKLDELRPNANLLLTFCDHFHVFFDQIDAHHLRLIEDKECDCTYPEVVTKWYDDIYFPVIEIIREQGILHHFPERTEADLYLLFVEHQEELLRALGWHIDTDATVVDMLESKTLTPRSIIGWLGLHLYKVLVPEELDAGPEPGHWRKIHLAHRKRDSLFASILIGLQEDTTKWHSFDQAVVVAKRESGSLFGLHIISDQKGEDSKEIEVIRSNFEQRCQDEGLVGEFSIEKGNVAQTILKRATWADVVVLSLTHPPHSQPFKRFGKGFSILVQRCPRPMLVVPSDSEPLMNRALLAYDGSPKANEALFVAAYIGSRWSIPLIVVTVETNNTPKTALRRAKEYFEKHGVDDVNYVVRQKPIGDSILETARAYDVNLLIMGGFGFRPVLNLVLGSTVDQVLREFKQPILICR
jgi:nucleotide-binding universal stress UspA family protein